MHLIAKILRGWRGKKVQARPYPGPWTVDADPNDLGAYRKALEERNAKIAAWNALEDERVARLNGK